MIVRCVPPVDLDSNDDSYSLGDETEDVKYSEDEESADELDMPYWVTAVSLPEKFDPKLEEFVPEESDYEEECDSDYELPVSDDDTDSEIEEQDEEIKLLAKESEEDVKEQMGSLGSEEPALETETTSDQSPSMWEEKLFNTEPNENFDSDEDEEYAPPVALDSSFEYDEYELEED